jgi:hypothetical protein
VVRNDFDPFSTSFDRVVQKNDLPKKCKIRTDFFGFLCKRIETRRVRIASHKITLFLELF